MSPLYRLRRALARRFYVGYRLRFYRMLSLQMRNGVKLLEALEQISNMYTDFGQRTHGFGLLVDDCRAALTDNSGDNSLEHALANWVPAEEAALISAGMFSGRLPEALAEAEILIDCRRRIRQAVLRMAIYPRVALRCSVARWVLFRRSLFQRWPGCQIRRHGPECWEAFMAC